MALEVMSSIANAAVKTAMSIEPMVEKSSNTGFMGVVIGIVVGAVLAAWLYSLKPKK